MPNQNVMLLKGSSVQSSWHGTLQTALQSIRQRSMVYNWGGFSPKQVMDRLSKGAKQAQGKGSKPGPFGKGKDSKPEPGGSGEGGGGSNGGQGPTWSDAAQAALLIAALIAYNSFGTSGGSSTGRIETIDFQTFRNSVLAKDIVDKVCLLSALAPAGNTLFLRLHRDLCFHLIPCTWPYHAVHMHYFCSLSTFVVLLQSPAGTQTGNDSLVRLTRGQVSSDSLSAYLQYPH